MEESYAIVTTSLSNSEYPNIVRLLEDFKDDGVYKLLCKSGFADKIVTNGMRTRLHVGRTYILQDALDIIESDEEVTTVRNLLNGSNSIKMPYYLHSEKELRVRHLPADSVFKLRMIFLVKREIGYTYNKIAEFGLGEDPSLSHLVTPAEELANLRDELSQYRQETQSLRQDIFKLIEMVSPEKITEQLKQSVFEVGKNLLDSKTNELDDLAGKYEDVRSKIIEKDDIERFLDQNADSILRSVAKTLCNTAVSDEPIKEGFWSRLTKKRQPTPQKTEEEILQELQRGLQSQKKDSSAQE